MYSLGGPNGTPVPVGGGQASRRRGHVVASGVGPVRVLDRRGTLNSGRGSR